MAENKAPDWGSTTVTLKKPVSFGGVNVTTVAIRNPSGADYLRFMRKSGTYQERILAFAMDLMEQPEEFLAALEARDCATILDTVGNFTLPWPAT